MDTTTAFQTFVDTFGWMVWKAQAAGRRRRNHGGGECFGISGLLGKAGACHACESDFEDLLLDLFHAGPWRPPQRRATDGVNRRDLDTAA